MCDLAVHVQDAIYGMTFDGFTLAMQVLSQLLSRPLSQPQQLANEACQGLKPSGLHDK
jgi:hypothetical protein